MQMVSLSASARTTEQSARDLRVQGRVPGVVYGNSENMLFSCDEVELRKAYIQAGESTVVELALEGKTIPVLFHTYDLDPVSDRFIHVDLYAVDMKKEVEAEVHIRMEGESPAVKDLGGILVTTLDSVTVRALPSKLPHDLPLDLSALTEINGALHISDLPVPEGVTILQEADEVIVLVQEPRAEEPEEAPATEAAEAAAPAEGAAQEAAA